jgi:hypothetical protein
MSMLSCDVSVTANKSDNYLLMMFSNGVLHFIGRALHGDLLSS